VEFYCTLNFTQKLHLWRGCWGSQCEIHSATRVPTFQNKQHHLLSRQTMDTAVSSETSVRFYQTTLRTVIK